MAESLRDKRGQEAVGQFVELGFGFGFACGLGHPILVFGTPIWSYSFLNIEETKFVNKIV